MMIATSVALLLVSAGFVTYELVTFRQKMKVDISTIGEIAGDLNDASLSFDRPDEARKILSTLKKMEHITGAALYDKDGKLFAQYVSTNNPNETFPLKPEAEGARFEKDRLLFFKKIYDADEFDGTVCLKSDLKDLDERFHRYVSIILMFTVVSLIVTFFLSKWLQRIISRPIFRLADTAMAVSADKNYSMRAIKHGNDEIGQLIDRFNEMLGQIQKRDSDLQLAHDQLEVRVEERTRDLRAEIGERENAESALKQQLVRISLLNQITQAISDRQDTDSILHVVLRQLEDHMVLTWASSRCSIRRRAS